MPERSGADRAKRLVPGTLGIFTRLETALHAGVAAVLVVLAFAALVNTAAHLTFRGSGFLPALLGTVNGVLLVIIVLEILRTVLAHFEEGGFPLREFLVIGVISATRHILSIAVELTVSHDSPAAVRLSLLGLLSSAAVVVGLVAALFLLSRSPRFGEAPAEKAGQAAGEGAP
ncbi:MAG TPA: phosphate-starvation-inducible PsiE family protein [Actinomycetota bacterium]|nr:phosphate-starvation-inducible PsiE family protein [Actinomycetota bacterium]